MEDWSFIETRRLFALMKEHLKGQCFVRYFDEEDLLQVSITCDEFYHEETIEGWSKKVCAKEYIADEFILEFKERYSRRATKFTLNRILKGL